MKRASLGLLLLVAASLPAQNAIPPGTVLPLQLDTGLNAAKVNPGQVIRAEVMQNIPGTPVRRGAHVLGHVIGVTPSRIEIRFDTLVAHGQSIPLTASLRVLASMIEVEQAQDPEAGPDRGTPPAFYTTQQIGGEQVYRGGGPVARGLTIVGEPTPNGVLVHLNANPPCRAAIADDDHPQALWLFSSDACGLYGYDNLAIDHAGRSAPIGTIQLSAKSGKLNIRSGSGLLLRVHGS